MMTRQLVSALQKDLDALLADFAQRNSLNVTPSQIKFTDEMFEVRMRFSNQSDNPDGVDPRFKVDLLARGKQIGLTPDMIGVMVIVNETPMQFLGMRASKIVVRSMEGEVFKVEPAFATKVIAAYNATKKG